VDIEEFSDVFRKYRETRVLHTAIQLNLFELLQEGATAKEIASRAESDERATEKLLNALVSLNVIEKRDGKFFHTDLSQKYLTKDGEHSKYFGFLHTTHGWDSWNDLPTIVKTGELPERARGFDDPERYRAFILAMHDHQKNQAADVVKQLPVKPGMKILDCGGGPGTYAHAFAEEYPECDATLFDLPDAINIAKEIHGENAPIEYIGGDFFKDDLGGPYDLIFLSNIIHSWSPEENQQLFQRLSDALNPEGKLIIRDRFLDEDKSGPKPAVLFSLHMLVNNLVGSCYTVSEVKDWMRAVSIYHVKYESLEENTEIVSGEKMDLGFADDWDEDSAEN